MPHVTALSHALWYTNMPKSCNCSRNPTADSHAVEPHACTSCAMLACALLCLALAHLSALCSHAHHALHSTAHCTTHSRAHCTHALARYCVRHPHTPSRTLSCIACAHATAYALLPRPSQCASPALFLRLPQAHPFAAKTRHKGPSQATAVGPMTYGGDTWPKQFVILNDIGVHIFGSILFGWP